MDHRIIDFTFVFQKGVVGRNSEGADKVEVDIV